MGVLHTSLRCAPLLLSVAAAAMASTTTCPSQTTVAAYLVSGFSCAVDDVLLSDFAFSSSGNVPIAASAITVHPVANTGGLFFPFDPFLTVGSSSQDTSNIVDFTISFEMSALNGLTLSGLTLDFNGFGNHGGGSSVTASYCADHPLAGCPAGQEGELVTGSTQAFTVAAALPNANTVNIVFEATVFSGSQGSGSLAQFEFGTQAGSAGPGGGPVPEAGTFILLAGGLLGLTVLRPKLAASR